MKFFWGCTLVLTSLATLVFLATLNFSKGAPQEAAGYAMACALAVVPYVFTRAAAYFLEPSMPETMARIEGIMKRMADRSAE